MVNIFFVPGMFGSTIENVIRAFTKEYNEPSAEILFDGSMHSVDKKYHSRSLNELKNNSGTNESSIATIIYPFHDAHFSEIVRRAPVSAHNILICAADTAAAELNMIFQYRKIATGSINATLEIMVSGQKNNIQQWGKYTHWSNMAIWELREWISLFYPGWVKEWVDAKSDTFLTITNIEMLTNTAAAFESIINHCGLTIQNDLAGFSKNWRDAQQYILDEFDLVGAIVSNTVNQLPFKWDSDKLSIISESIIQQRLRCEGYELKCHALNIFPNDTKTLYSLLQTC